MRAIAALACVFSLATLLAPSFAEAQEAEPPAVYAAVYDFVAPGRYEGHMIGRRLGEALHASLASEAPWTLVPRNDLLRQCATEGVSAPVGVGYLQMFGRRLNAPLAVTGMVQNLVVNQERGTVQVTLVAELLETIDGNSLTSVSAVGSASREGDATMAMDEILDKAFMEAVGDLGSALSAFDPWVTTVLTGMNAQKAILNAPADTEVQTGTKLLVFRQAGGGWSIVGALQVTRGSKDTIRAKMLTTSEDPLRTGDVAVAVAR